MDWRIVGASVQGASHKRAGKPNQDAIAWTAQDRLPIAVALSDGHGSARCFRSDAGARIAVDLAIRVLQEMAGLVERECSEAEMKDAKQALRLDIVRLWRAAVEDALRTDPLSAEELSALETQSG